MRIAVTGTSGRVGAAVAALLLERADVVGIDVRPGELTSVVGDIADRPLLDRAFCGVTAVVHCAGLHAPHVATHSAGGFRRTNIDGTLAVLEASQRAGVKRLVYTSTTSLYGHALVPDGAAVWVTEDLPPQPRDIYDETKLAAEQLCREAAAGGLAAVALRISRCFPEPGRQMQIYRLYRGVAICDVARAHRAALTAEIAHFEAFNISAQSPFQREDCQALLTDAADVIRRRMPAFARHFERQGWALPDHVDRIYVIDKARRLLGYSPLANADGFFSNDAKKR